MLHFITFIYFLQLIHLIICLFAIINDVNIQKNIYFIFEYKDIELRDEIIKMVIFFETF